MQKVAVIDDDPLVPMLVRGLLTDEAVQVVHADTAAAGQAMLERERPDVLLLDILLPDRSGLELFRAVHARDPRLPVVVITSQGTSDLAIQTMAEGAFDFLVKPLDRDELRTRVQRALALRRMTRQVFDVCDTAELKVGTGVFLIGRSAAMRNVYKEIGRLAAQDSADVLLCGETGTGKELTARTITHYSRRAEKPFVVLACTGVDETELEHRLSDRPRRKSNAETEAEEALGTWFFDEIADLSLSLQARLSQVLQTRSRDPNAAAGGPRILAATRHDLEMRVRDGLFRPDLYFQLQTFRLRLPALRERPDDLEPLCRHFVKLFNPLLGKRVYQTPPEVLELFRRRTWPGNIRELQSLLKNAMMRATGAVLTPDLFGEEDLPAEPLHRETPAAGPTESASGAEPRLDWARFVDERLEAGSRNIHQEAQEQMERLVLSQVLKRTAGNQAQAALRLGITRTMLRNRIRLLGIQIEKHTEISTESEAG